MNNFYLCTIEYDSMCGSMQSGIEPRYRELKADEFDDAVNEALALYSRLPKYRAAGGRTEYPKNPQLVYDLEKKRRVKP